MILYYSLGIFLIAHAAFGDDTGRIKASRCRQTFIAGPGNRYMGQAGWQDQADKTIAGSTEDRTVGETQLFCTVRLPAPATSAVLDLKATRVSFSGKHADGGPSGLEIAAIGARNSVCRLRGVRTSREDWIELGAGLYALEFPQSVDRFSVTLRLIDLSDKGSVRADVAGISVRLPRAGETLSACPPAAQ